MNKTRTPCLSAIATLVATCLLWAGQTPRVEDIEWPRESKTDGHSVVMYQPQVDSWSDYKGLTARAAVVVTLEGTNKPIYGAMTLTATTQTDFETRQVLLADRKIQSLRFPNAPKDQAVKLAEIVRKALLPRKKLTVALDFLLANVHRTEVQQRTIEINLDPPPIFRSEKPAILVIYTGEPGFQPIRGTSLMFCTNTNWDVFLDPSTTSYYLRNGESWLTAPDPVKGPWKAAARLPADLDKLPNDKNWEDVRRNLPGKRAEVPPVVFTSKEPAELILTDGTPTFTPITGTKLMFVSNTKSDVFLLTSESNYYFLTAGRWFRAASLDGPWKAATTSLPAEFAKIPEDHPRGHVLASVPGSPVAEEAALMAQIPRQVTVKRDAAKVTVVYEGKPEFVVIDGMTVYYAINTPYDVFRVDNAYYCCYQGIWFESKAATGPWVVCTKVPAVLYQIPATHPKHNVTYVYVYDSTPSTVVVGYTAGYTGVYVAAGLVMFGMGYHYYHYHAYCHYHCHAHYYGYGCGAHYNHYSGTYYRATTAYGPYGGAGRGAAYDPSTGTYHRGAYAYGPSGSAYAREAYNPRTGTYAARAGGSDAYGSWNRSVVTRGDEWARGASRTDGTRSAAGFETSRGAKGIGVKGPEGQAGIYKNRHGDVYVGKDGNIYKHDPKEGWQKRSENGWTSARSGGQGGPSRASEAARSGNRSRSRELERASRSRSRGNSSSGRYRSSGGSRYGGRWQSSGRARSHGGGRRGGGRR